MLVSRINFSHIWIPPNYVAHHVRASQNIWLLRPIKTPRTVILHACMQVDRAAWLTPIKGLVSVGEGNQIDAPHKAVVSHED